MADDREGVAKTNFYGFVKPIEYMHVLEKAIQEITVVHVQTCGVGQCAIMESLTKSQAGRGSKGPLEVMISKLPAQAGLPRASC